MQESLGKAVLQIVVVDPSIVRWPHQQRQSKSSVVMIDWRKHIAHPIVGDTLAHVDSTDMYVLVE